MPTPQQILAAVHSRHTKDIRALMGAMSEGEQGAFTDGLILGSYYAGFVKCGATCASLMEEAGIKLEGK